MKERFPGIIASIFAYLVALGTALLTGNVFRVLPPLVMIILADLMATFIIFVFSLAFNNSSIYDPYWSIKPVVIAGYYFLHYFPGEVPARQILVLVFVLLYGIRLTSNFYRDWQGLEHEDWRYIKFRKQFPGFYWLVSFFGIHLFPTLLVYLGCLPMFAAMASGTKALNLWDAAGTLVLAFIADEQLRNFKKNLANKGKYISSGLWKISRHPNYLGEILTWWGLYLFALAAGYAFWWMGLGALLITLMFIFISIPLMEKKNLEEKEGYSDYIKRTPVLLPARF